MTRAGGSLGTRLLQYVTRAGGGGGGGGAGNEAATVRDKSWGEPGNEAATVRDKSWGEPGNEAATVRDKSWGGLGTRPLQYVTRGQELGGGGAGNEAGSVCVAVKHISPLISVACRLYSCSILSMILAFSTF